jgi:hypothetical protein
MGVVFRQKVSDNMWIALRGHSAAQMPWPLQQSN